MSACVNCDTRAAVYRVAPVGASPADFCELDLPPFLRERAATGEFNLHRAVPTVLWVQRGETWIEVVRSGEHLVPAAEERAQVGRSSGPIPELVDEPLQDDEQVLELPVGQAPA